MLERRKKLISVLVLLVVAAATVLIAVVSKNRNAEFEAESHNGLAMGTVVSMKLYHETPTALSTQVMGVIDALEQEISWRVETSPVAELNRTGSCKSAVVASAVEACAPISEATDKAFDLTVGAVSSLWDFGGENEGLPDKTAIEQALKTVNSAALQTNGTTVTAEKGQKLDLGAVGKGLACDKIKAFLTPLGIKGAVVSVGGSICVFGARNKAGDPWRVAIRHPRKDNALLGTIRLKEGFVSTSGDYEKFFEQDGKRYFHILDARTGYPAETGLCSVTVVCDNGLISDALSTACFLLDEKDSEPLLEQYGASAVFVTEDGTVSTFGSIDFTAYES